MTLLRGNGRPVAAMLKPVMYATPGCWRSKSRSAGAGLTSRSCAAHRPTLPASLRPFAVLLNDGARPGVRRHGVEDGG